MAKAFRDYVRHFIPDVNSRQRLYMIVSDEDIKKLAGDLAGMEKNLVGPLELTEGEIGGILEDSSKPEQKR